MPILLLQEADLHEAVRDLITKRGLEKNLGSPRYQTQFTLRPKTTAELVSQPGALNTFEVRVEPLPVQ